MLGAKPLHHEFRPSTYEIFAGLDVDARSISVSFGESERVIRSLRIPYDPDALLAYARKHFPGRKIAFAYEAGPTGYGLHDRLSAAGHCCLVVAPSTIPIAPGQRVKTNRLDGLKLMAGLRTGQLRGIHVPSVIYRHLRHLTQLRDTAVRQATAAKCRIKALLLFEGIPFPECPATSQWSSRVTGQLQQLACAPTVHFKLDQLLSSLAFAQSQVLQTTREIRRFCAQEPELHECLGYLKSIPGLGEIVASQLLARIGDWRRLRHVRQLGAFIGVVASEHSTGETIRRGSITRSGDGRLRSKLIQGAWAAIRQDAELREFYQRVRQRNPGNYGGQKAIVAVARKMTMRIYAVLHDQRPYQIRPLSVGDPREEIMPQGTTRGHAEPKGI